jgi:hypothetical protein
MKIAYVVEADLADEARAHARALNDRGHEVHVFDPEDDDPLGGLDLIVGRDIEAERVFAIGRIVDEEYYRAKTPVENEPMRVLLAGASQIESKGIEEGYGAVGHARWFHQKFDLIRTSPWAPSREEPLDDVQEFHVALSAREMARLVQSCDVIIGSSRAGDAFGLPVAQALAAGVPAVVTDVPAYRSFDIPLVAPAENPIELGEKLIELLSDYELRDRLRTRGRAIAEQWRKENVIDRLEAFFVEQLSVRQR